MSKTEPFPVYVVWGPDPEEEAHKGTALLAVDNDESDAEAYLTKGVFMLAQEHIRELKKGGTMSLILTRGRPSTDGDPGSTMYASLVISNPDDRADWDFRIEKRMARITD